MPVPSKPAPSSSTPAPLSFTDHRVPVVGRCTFPECDENDRLTVCGKCHGPWPECLRRQARGLP